MIDFKHLHLSFIFTFTFTFIISLLQASYTCSVSAFKKTEVKHSLTVRGESNYQPDHVFEDFNSDDGDDDGNDDDSDDDNDNGEDMTTCEWRIADLWYQLGLRWKPEALLSTRLAKHDHHYEDGDDGHDHGADGHDHSRE